MSSCLLGQPIRFNGSDAASDKTILSQLQTEGRLVQYCPELAAGFPVPRPAAETVGGDGKLVLIGQAKVFEDTGADVTELFVEGAKKTLAFAQKNKVRIAILTDGSPSCGSTYLYDGNFTGKKIPGRGVTAELLEQNGIRVFSEDQIDDAVVYLRSVEESGADEAI